MNFDIDNLISLMKSGNSVDSELGEQDAAASPAPSTGGGGSVPKWADSYQTKRGHANPLMASGQKWETGLTRGSANQIW